ncbi:exported hypothetical protein [[Clostridium] ultunense Esp]|nr:exported hypothetical protein [[Clostridium] ultunense Esp]
MRVGRATTGVSLILIGIILLLGMSGQGEWAAELHKFWPLIIVGYGLEMLLFGKKEGPVRFDWGGAILVVVVLGLLPIFSFTDGRIHWNAIGKTASITAESRVRDPGDFTSLRVLSTHGDIEISTSTDGKITVIPTYRMAMADEESLRREMEKIPVHLQENGNQLIVQVEWPKDQLFFIPSMTSVDLKVYAPKGMKIEGESGNGKIAVVGMDRVGRIHTSNGEIELRVSAGEADLDTSNGKIVIAGYKGSLNAKTSNGSIEASGEMTGAWSIHTSNGSVRLTLPPSGSYAYDLRTGNGSIDVPDPPFSENKGDDHYQGVVNGGQFPLTVDTSNGSIRITLTDRASSTGATW